MSIKRFLGKGYDLNIFSARLTILNCCKSNAMFFSEIVETFPKQFDLSFNCFFAAAMTYYLISSPRKSRGKNYVFTKGWSNFLVRNLYLQSCEPKHCMCDTLPFTCNFLFVWYYFLTLFFICLFVISPSIFLGIIQCNSVQCTLTFS